MGLIEQNWEIRRQVPENDPVYQERRNRNEKLPSGDVLGRANINDYYGTVDRYAQENADLRSKLDKEKKKFFANKNKIKKLSAGLKYNTEFAEEMKEKGKEYLQRDFEGLTKSLCFLELRMADEDTKAYILNEVKDMFSAPEMEEEIKNNFGNQDLSNIIGLDLYAKAIQHSFSEKAIYAAIKRHNENVKHEEERLEEIFKKTREEFKGIILEEVAAGRLPKEAAMNLSRIDQVEARLSDRLRLMYDSSIGSCGNGDISIKNELLQDKPGISDQLKKVIFHELLHDLSGKSITTIVMTAKTQMGYPISASNVIHKKSGLALNSSSVEDMTDSINRWLNEAVTEWLALKLAGGEDTEGKEEKEYLYKGSYSYTTERRELDRLFAEGLEEDLVTRAYFQNIFSDQPKGERGNAYPELIKRINQLEGRFGFARLENKQIMQQIARNMASFNSSEIEIAEVRKNHFPGAEIFNIDVEAGTNEKNKIKERFTFIIEPDTKLPKKEQLAALDDTLAKMKIRFGNKMAYKISMEDY